MSFETDFDTALTILLGKAQGTITVPGPVQPPTPNPTTSTRGATLHYPFGGGSAPVVAATCEPQTIEIPWPATIVSAHLWAGDASGAPVAVSAMVDVVLTTLLTFGASTPLYGNGSAPSLQAEPTRDCNLSGWILNLTGTDAVRVRLVSFTGSATWVLLVIRIIPSQVDLGITSVTDNAGTIYTDQFGNPYVFRS